MIDLIRAAVSAAFPNELVSVNHIVLPDNTEAYCIKVDNPDGYCIYIIREDEWARDLGAALFNAGVRFERGTLWV